MTPPDDPRSAPSDGRHRRARRPDPVRPALPRRPDPSAAAFPPAGPRRPSRRGSLPAAFPAAFLTALLAVGALAPVTAPPAEAQPRHRFRLSTGVGLQFFAHPDLRLGRGASLAGAAAIRASDNFSFETGLFFGRSNQRYTATDEPVQDVLADPAYQFRMNRYHLDGSFVFHLGRRQPFHAWILAGGGVVRRDSLREDFDFTTPAARRDGLLRTQPARPRIRVPVGTTVSLDETVYQATAHLGVGFEVYIFDYLSARAEYRLWSPRDFSHRTQQAIIGVNFYR